MIELPVRMLAKLPGLSGRVILVHGFNVRDNGAGTTGMLRPHFEQCGFEVLEYGTGWRGLLGVRFGNAKRARRLARMLKAGDIVLGHSDGCNLINQACWGGSIERDCPIGVVYLNAALDCDTQLAPQVKSALVGYTPSDRVVKLSRWLPFHRWGSMGAKGYQEKRTIHEDGRYVNYMYEQDGMEKCGHSGVFKDFNYRVCLFNRIQKWIRTLEN